MTNEQTLEFLSTAANQHASDIFIIAGRPLSIKKWTVILLIMENV